MIVGVLTICHTKYTSDNCVGICRIKKGAHIENL